ncbi:hypothetical protein ACLK1T_23095 [Escherichia coli]
MAYSDAGSAFIFGSLVGPKWTRCLMAQDLSLVSGYYGNYLRHCTVSILRRHRCDGDFNSHSRRYVEKALNISKIESFVAVTTIFLGQNEIPGDRQTLYESSELQ